MADYSILANRADRHSIGRWDSLDRVVYPFLAALLLGGGGVGALLWRSNRIAGFAAGLTCAWSGLWLTRAWRFK